MRISSVSGSKYAEGICCGREDGMRSLIDPCACGSFDRALTAGDELRLAAVEVL